MKRLFGVWEMIKRIIAFTVLTLYLLNVTVFADASISTAPDPETVVTEYYSVDLYEDTITASATIPMSTAPEIAAKSVILMECSTGKVLYENNSDESLSPASITKIMTMLLISECLDNGSLLLTDKVTASEHAVSMGGSQIWLEVGEQMTVEELLKAVAVGSANDASVALAEHIAGSEEGFVGMMNEKAQTLGMSNTVFKNACGLDEDGHITSARDVAIMSCELLKHDVIKQFTTIWMDSLRNGSTELVNTNKLVRFYSGATGLKTGTTDKAGCCLSASAKHDGMEIVAVVMNAESSNERFTGAKKLLDYGFANWCLSKPEFDESSIDNIKVEKGVKEQVNIDVEPLGNELLSKSESGSITVETDLPDYVAAPVEKDTVIGNVKVLLNGEVISKYNVYATETVDKISFGFLFNTLISKLLNV